MPIMIVMSVNCLQEGKKSSLSEWQVNSAWNVYCTNPLKTEGCLAENKLNSYPQSRKSYPHGRNLDGDNRLLMKQKTGTLWSPAMSPTDFTNHVWSSAASTEGSQRQQLGIPPSSNNIETGEGGAISSTDGHRLSTATQGSAVWKLAEDATPGSLSLRAFQKRYCGFPYSSVSSPSTSRSASLSGFSLPLHMMNPEPGRK